MYWEQASTYSKAKVYVFQEGKMLISREVADLESFQRDHAEEVPMAVGRPQLRGSVWAVVGIPGLGATHKAAAGGQALCTSGRPPSEVSVGPSPQKPQKYFMRTSVQEYTVAALAILNGAISANHQWLGLTLKA